MSLQMRRGTTAQWAAASGATLDEGEFGFEYNGSTLVGIKVGPGQWSALSYIIGGSGQTPATAPGAPTNLTATPGTTQVALSWTAPASPGTVTGGNTATLTDYVIEFSTNGGSSWTTISDGTSTSTTFTHTGLTAGTAHVYRVSARNSANLTGVPSGTATATPTSGGASAPAQVTGLAAIFLNPTSIEIGWNQPANNGAAITDYVVQFKRTVDASWSTFADGTAATLGATVTGLTAATSYDFRVAAVNSVGQGAFSAVHTNTTSGGAQAPLAPTITEVDAADGSYTVTYTLGGGGTPTSLEMQWAPAFAPTEFGSATHSTGTHTSTDVASPTTFTAFSVPGGMTGTPGNTNGNKMRLRAVNGTGTSPWSAVFDFNHFES
jgi:hypothetical protein